MEIGNRLRQRRQAMGLTLEELASRSELTKGFLSQVERDLTSPAFQRWKTFSKPWARPCRSFSPASRKDPGGIHRAGLVYGRAGRLHH